jgi:polysaccharide export outer membrane protein
MLLAWVRLSLVVISAATLVSCASRPLVLGGESVRLVASPELPAPTDPDRLFAIGAGDRLSFQIYGIPDSIRNGIVVDNMGFVSLPIIGSVRVGGLTIPEGNAEVNARLRAAHVRNPVAVLNFEQVVSPTFVIEGEVENPGLYPANGNTSLVRAVAAAQGTTEFARIEDVLIFRTVGNQRYLAAYNFSAVRAGNYPDPRIYPGDTIVVGDSPARRRFRDLIQIAPLLTAPLIAVIQNF